MPAPPRFPAAVIFDHDGVLVESEPLHWAAWERLLSELGLPYNNAEMRALVGVTAPEILTRLLGRHQPGWRAEDFDVHALARRKNEFYLASAADRLRCYPGVPEGIRWLRSQGTRVAVVSNAKRRELETALRQLDLFDYFDLVLSRDDVPAPKPDPSAYLTAVTLLGVEAHDCFVLEDSPTGLESALLARIPACAVLTNFPEHALARPVPVRPELRPSWIGPAPRDFFDWLRTLAGAPTDG